jgi:hypothetical protein
MNCVVQCAVRRGKKKFFWESVHYFTRAGIERELRAARTPR